MSKFRKYLLWGLPTIFSVLVIILLVLRADYLSAREGWATHTNLPANWFSDMEIAMAGQEWEGPSNGVRVYDGKTWVSDASLPMEFIDTKDHTWKITYTGLTMSDGEKTIKYHGEYINAFVLDPLGRPWVATSFDGVQVLYPDGSRKFYTHANSGLHTTRIDEILFDSSGNIWFCDRLNSSASTIKGGEYLPETFNIGFLKFIVSSMASVILVAALFYILWGMRLLGNPLILFGGLSAGLIVASMVTNRLLGWNEMSWVAGSLTIGLPFGWMIAIFLENYRYRFQADSKNGSLWVHSIRLLSGLIIICVGFIVAGVVSEYLLDLVWSNEILWMDGVTPFIISFVAGIIPVKISFMLLPGKRYESLPLLPK